MTLPGSAYNWKTKQLWDTNPPQGDFSVSTGTEAGQWVGSQLAPYSQDWTSGYDAMASDTRYSHRTGSWKTISTSSALWNKLLAHSNSNFCNNEYYVPLFVNEISLQLGISGSMAQSQTTRDFYPHNIVIPSFTISGQCYSTAQYGSLIEYIHMVQHESLNTNGDSDLIQFYLKSTSSTPSVGTRTSGLKVTYIGPNGAQVVAPAYNQKIVGPHDWMICQGYINSMQRTHQTGVYRPTWTANFVVSLMLASPLYVDTNVTEAETGTWLNLLSGVNAQTWNITGTPGQNWLTSANETKNKTTMAAVSAGASDAITNLESA